MLSLCAILSANLGVFNLLPLPGLDGGRLAFVFIEAIRRKPLPVEKEGLVHFIGFVLLMILAVFIAFSDIRKLL
jgi:regulator of sigma E protease